MITRNLDEDAQLEVDCILGDPRALAVRNGKYVENAQEMGIEIG